MKPDSWGAIALIAGVALVYLSTSKADTPSPNEELLVIGDSLGVGVGAALRRRGVKVAVNAISGSAARWWAEGSRWEEALRGHRIAIVSLGSNDIAQKRAPWPILQQLEGRARRVGVRLVWIVPATPLWAQQAVQMPGESVLLRGAEGTADGVHLTASGYRTAAERVAQQLGVA